MENSNRENDNVAARPDELGPAAKFYPLDRVRLGVWESRLHKDGQLFAMVLPTKFVYVIVHPARELSSPTHNQKLFIENLGFSELSWQKQKKQILRLFGSRNPFTTCEGEKVDFYGVVTFEVNHADIGGMECSNSLIHQFSRLVFEAKTLRKKAFVTLEDFFIHYNLETRPDQKLHYVPTLNHQDNKIEVRTCWKTMQQHESAKPASQLAAELQIQIPQDELNEHKCSGSPAKKHSDQNQWAELSGLSEGAEFFEFTPGEKVHQNQDRRKLSATNLNIPLSARGKQGQAQSDSHQLTDGSNGLSLIRKRSKETDDLSVASQGNLDEIRCQLFPCKADLMQNRHQSQQGNKIHLSLNGEHEERKERPCVPIAAKSLVPHLCLSGTSSHQDRVPDSDETCCKEDSSICQHIEKCDADVSINANQQNSKGKPVNDVTYAEMTIIASFEDPGFQQALKELLFKPENKEMLLKYEQSLPSWTIVLAQYTGKYRAWMRHTVRIICFLASCITLSIACYDLYKNFPLLRTFLDTYFKETHEWLEQIFHEQVTVWMGCILYVFWPLQYFYETLKSSEIFMQVINGALYPIVYIGQSLWACLQLIFDLLWPLKALLKVILRASFSLVWNILCLPFTIAQLFYMGCYNFVGLLGGFQSSVSSVNQVAVQAPTVSDTQEAFSMIAYGTQLCITWSQSITNKVVRASKSVYDFVVYVGCEIGKHNYTIQVYLYEQTWLLYQATRAKMNSIATGSRIKLAWKSFKILIYGFIIFFIIHVSIVLLRERFELQGCVLCIDQNVDKISALVQTQRDNFVQSQIRDGLEPNSSENLLKQAASHFIRGLLDTVITIYEKHIVQRIVNL